MKERELSSDKEISTNDWEMHETNEKPAISCSRTSKSLYIEILLPVEKGPHPPLLVVGVEFLRHPPKKNFLRLA